MKVFATAAWFKHLGSPFARMIFAATIAGACTFLNVYCTQPLLPFFQRLFHASEVEVSLTVGAVTLSVALMAPLIGLAAETLGRKKIIVLALFAMGIVSLLTATSNDLHGMIFWRFAQGLFVPGVIAVIMAFINEEFPAHAGIVMSAYVTGTVFGGFLGRFLTGLIAVRWDWRVAFIVLGVLDLFGALAVRQWLPSAVHFVSAKSFSQSLGDIRDHVRNPKLMAVCCMGFTVLFSLVGVFTYVSFYLAKSPFNLSPAAFIGQSLFCLSGGMCRNAAGRPVSRSARFPPYGVVVGVDEC